MRPSRRPPGIKTAEKGTEMIAPNRASRSVTQDGRPRRRWTVERTIAWLQNYRRLCIR